MKQETPIDWIIQEMKKLAFDPHHHLGSGDVRITQGMIEEWEKQGKLKEKDCIKNAWHDGNILGRNGWIVEDYNDSDQYYTKTYGVL